MNEKNSRALSEFLFFYLIDSHYKIVLTPVIFDNEASHTNKYTYLWIKCQIGFYQNIPLDYILFIYLNLLFLSFFFI